MVVALGAVLLAAGSALAPESYAVEVTLFDGDPARPPAGEVMARQGGSAYDGRAGRPVAFLYPPPQAGIDRPIHYDTSFRVWVFVSPRRLTFGTALEVMALVQKETPSGPPAKEIFNSTTLPIVPGRPVRHTVSTRSPTDQTWLEVTVRPAE
ncbi:MAG: hypothetical protein K2X82_04985 [Gemmataceae bacterium]|nr:hypothetical protein [Gemmataceae bacterium]